MNNYSLAISKWSRLNKNAHELICIEMWQRTPICGFRGFLRIMISVGLENDFQTVKGPIANPNTISKDLNKKS
jgi:hypothetical protein